MELEEFAATERQIEREFNENSIPDKHQTGLVGMSLESVEISRHSMYSRFSFLNVSFTSAANKHSSAAVLIFLKIYLYTISHS